MRWGARVVAFAWMSSAVASADDKSDCVVAYSNAQDLRKGGALGAAAEQMKICGRAVCPSFIAADCTQWFGEIEQAMPTVVLAVKDQGRDVVDVRVILDGATIAEQLDGQPIRLDPGRHKVELQRTGRSISDEVVIRMGEKNRQLAFAFPVDRIEPVVVDRPIVSHEPRPSHTLLTVGLVVGAGGLVGLAAGGITGAVAVVTKNDNCGSDNVCKRGVVSTLSSEATFTTASLIAGGVLAAAGLTFTIFGLNQRRKAAWIAPAIGSLMIEGRW